MELLAVLGNTGQSGRPAISVCELTLSATMGPLVALVSAAICVNGH